MVSLVNENCNGGRELSKEGLQVLALRKTGRGIVRIANVDQAGGSVGAREHGFQVVRIIMGERYFDDLGPQSFCAATDGFKCGQRSDELFAGTEKSGRADTEDLAGTAAEHELLGLDGMRSRDSIVKRLHSRIGVAIRKSHGVFHRGNYFLRWAVRVFIAAQNNRLGVFGGARWWHRLGEGEAGEGRQAGADGRAGGNIANEVSTGDLHGFLAIRVSLIAGMGAPGQEFGREIQRQIEVVTQMGGQPSMSAKSG